MPFIAFESGQLTDEVKVQLIEKLTEVSVEITGIPKELFLVSIREQPDANIAVAGKSVEQIKKEIAQKQ
ncbi:tautomerase family protein [Vibrio atypicus]|uniref:tautomerase family protein n=1 Tax=Vibrio atypicus TaxID=558271 RepID=UPI0013593D44|nr:tautomerase family protein [Vibrio atypicus]